MAGKEDTVEEAEAAFLAAKEGRASQGDGGGDRDRVGGSGSPSC